MYTFYGFNTFNTIKVLLTAEELGLDYRLKLLDPTKGDLRQPEHKARHPLAKAPVLEHEGHHLIESASICRYLANTQNHKLYSSDPYTAAKIDQTMDLMGYHAGHWLAMVFWQEVILKNFFGREPNVDEITNAKQMLEKTLPAIERLLRENTYLCGPQLTIADTFSFAYFQIQEITSVTLDSYPKITAWYDSFNQRPSVAAVKIALAG